MIKIKFAIMGIRGIPANYGGFETFAEELAPRLVKKGHDVTVYGRSNIIKYNERQYKGVQIVILPTISHKYFDTIVHTFLSCIHSLFCSYDCILICNGANSILSWIPRIRGTKVVVNVDGIERQRKKWGKVGRLWYLFGEYFATKFPNKIVSDAEVIQKYYENKYKKESDMIPYGADVCSIDTREYLDQFNIFPNKYILYVSRFEPENNIHIVIQAFKKVNTEFKLVIIGDAPYSTEYKSYIKDLADSDNRVVLTGFLFGQGYREFQSHAYCYIQATEVGGTHPALIEAMGYGNCVLANGTPENIEVVADAGIIYIKNDIDDLSQKIEYIIEHSDVVQNYKLLATERIKKYYSWDSVAEQYEKLFYDLMQRTY